MRTEFDRERTALKSKFSKYGAKQLLKSLPNRTGLEAEVITEILVSRGALEKPKPPKKSKEEKPKGVRSKVYEISEETQALVEAAKVNKGKSVSFHCKALDKNMEGKIVGVRLDPRSNLIQYLIRTSEGTYGKKVGSDNLKIK